MLPPQAGPLSLPDFLQLVRQQWVLLGRGVRPLRDAELEALARRAGFVGGLSPQQLPLQPSALAAFAPWFAERLQVLAAVVPALCYPDAQLVAGLHVGRTEAADCLQCRRWDRYRMGRAAERWRSSAGGAAGMCERRGGGAASAARQMCSRGGPF